MNRIIWLLLACLATGAQSIKAQTTFAGTDQSKFLGYRLKESDIIKTTDAIVVGQFESLGEAWTDSPGEEYGNAPFEIKQTLKGPLSGKIKVEYAFYFTTVKSEKEDHPQLHYSYIAFIHFLSPGQYQIFKLLPATDANIAKVKALIAAAPASK